MPDLIKSNALYCSQSCISRVHRNHRRMRMPPRLCAQCGESFHPCKPGRRFCCHDCSVRARTTNHDRPCELCGKVFRPLAADSKFCSLSCVSKHGHATGRLGHFRLKLTPRRADLMFDRMFAPPRRPYRRRLTAQLFDRMVEKRFIVRAR